MGLFAWGADFPAAGAFFLSVLSCRSFHENPITSLNLAQYCNARADKLASKAQAEELTDPAAARTLWAQIDRTLTNQAPWVPVIDESPVGFVSSRVGNYQMAPGYTDLIDQMWVR
jgi:ABC-type transport system substrate-binding protein